MHKSGEAFMAADLEGGRREPLIHNKLLSLNLARLRSKEAKFRNFSEEEEATRIAKITYLRANPWKQWALVPLLSLCTGFFFLLFLYWYPTLRKKFLYSECYLGEATNLFILGTSKTSF